MRLGVKISLSLLTLTFAAGCASTEPREAIDPSSDPAWQPPGQGDLAVADPRPEYLPKAKPKPRARTLQQPNHADIAPGALASRKAATNR
jgi:hypothetical protein